MSGQAYWPEAILRAAVEAIEGVVARRVDAQDREDVVSIAMLKFLPHMGHLTLDSAPRYAATVATNACNDYAMLRRRLPATNEPLVDAALAFPEPEAQREQAGNPGEPPGARILAWFEGNAQAPRLGPQERRLLARLRSGQTYREMALLLGVDRSRVHQLVTAIGRKAKILAQRSHSSRLSEMD